MNPVTRQTLLDWAARMERGDEPVSPMWKGDDPKTDHRTLQRNRQLASAARLRAKAEALA